MLILSFKNYLEISNFEKALKQAKTLKKQQKTPTFYIFSTG